MIPGESQNSIRKHCAFCYSDIQNIIFKEICGETNYYSWDQDNRLTSVSNNASGNTVRFVYDHTGKRVKKLNEASGDTIYASGFFEKHNGLIIRHIFDGTRRIVSEQSDGSGYWYHTDHLGSTMFLTSTNGQVAQDIGYYAYGETRTNQGMATNIQYKFTGQEFDPETGLDLPPVFGPVFMLVNLNS